MSEAVVIYSAPWCVYCRALKMKLNAMKVSYKEKNVDEPGIQEEMNSKTNGNQTIPVLFIGDQFWVNPDDATLREHIITIDDKKE